MLILAVDPGASTGVILWETGDCRAEHVGTLRLWRGMDRLIAVADVVVYENFRLFPHLAKEQVGSEFPSSQVIGVLNYVAEGLTPPPVLVVQQPSNQSKSLFKDRVLKGWGFKWSTPHELSAIRHLCYWLYVERDTWMMGRLKEIA